ncbi:MAG: regulator [Magnetococcales bacterium]|nr:regulator [Magnetococcales bacterium]
MTLHRIFPWTLALLLAVTGCSEQPSPRQSGSGVASGTPPSAGPGTTPPPPPVPAGPEYTVLDSFEVGNNVYVRSLLTDANRKSLWVGTSAGVHEIDLETLTPQKTFTRKEGLANEYVFAIGQDADGAKWFGTNAGGMSRFHEGRWKTYFPMHGLADYWVYSFANHPDGSLWVGTWAGVNRFDRRAETFTTYVKELVNEWVYAMKVDAQGRVWFGTEGGVSRFDGREWREWTHKDGLGGENTSTLPASPNTGLGTRNRHDLGILAGGSPTYNPNYVFSLELLPGDEVWAGTWGGGVSRLTGDRWESFDSRHGLPGNIVYSLQRDGRGVLWAGTENGLGQMIDGRWRPFAENARLQGENIYALTVTHAGEVWAGTRGKVFRIGLEGAQNAAGTGRK